VAEKRIIVALDGPAGAGKSTIARRVAERLGFVYINTGAMYRSVALWALRLKTELTDMHRLEQLATEAQIEFAANGNVMLNGEDVSEAIRTEEVSWAASKVSALPAVRRALLGAQRKIAETASVVMEGRDIGSVVFPDAQVKIFLDADPNERARRRAAELLRRGVAGVDVEAVAADIRQRDDSDRTRTASPLVQAPDAELIDTTGLSLEQVEEAILRLVRSRTANGKEVAR
jgi:CMP/dCMP kinase